MDILQVLEARRSVRAFTDQAVTDQQRDQLIAAAAWAPSPLNLQPWQFVIITEPDAKKAVIEVCKAAHQAVMDAGGPDWVAKYSFDFLDQAPMLIAVLFEPKKGGLGSYFNNPMGALSAASASIQNLMLMASEMGLGTTWFTFYDPENMRIALGAPEDLEVAGILPVGVPAGETKAPPPQTSQSLLSKLWGIEKNLKGSHQVFMIGLMGRWQPHQRTG